MEPFRVLQVSIVVLLLSGSPWLVRAVELAAPPPDSSTAPAGPRAAEGIRGGRWLAGVDALAGRRHRGDNGDNHGGDNGGDNNGNGNSNGNGNRNGNGNGNDNFNFELPPLPSASTRERKPEPACTGPGQDTVFSSRDDKVTVRVFASTPRPVRVEILQVIDFLATPLPPGTLVGLLAYEIRASDCGANLLPQLPAEANLGIRYSEAEAIGLDKSRFVIGHLDQATGTWIPVEKRANDPGSNYVSATIVETGLYMVWQTR